MGQGISCFKFLFQVLFAFHAMILGSENTGQEFDFGVVLLCLSLSLFPSLPFSVFLEC